MTQTQLFMTLFVTMLFCIAGARELSRSNFSMGAVLIAVPICGWLAIWAKP